ncbi:hypothetical protein CXT76_00515 [Candidatus Parvarchaeota archaeon]|nr:MAG: hypothetical protein CXT76_00515 [Candidatus Parvarchaeota archaeon]
METINMKIMRYLNLLNEVSRVRTTKCFFYNNTLFFAVPPAKISQAIGPGGNNIKEISRKLRMKIRIMKDAKDLNDAKRFLEDIVKPLTFTSLEIKDDEIIITAGSRTNRASLFGRYKKRLEELKKITEFSFKKELVII